MSAFLPANAASQRLILLSGVEEGLRLQALRQLNELGEGDPFDTQSVTAGESPAIEWIAAASTVPFLSEKRTVIVRNLLRATSPSEALGDAAKALSSLPESARLILVADDELTSDFDRQRRLDNWKKAWETEVKKACGLVLEFKIDPKAAKVAVLKGAEEWGKSIDDRAADLLLEMTGRNLSRSLEELEKVALYVGDAPMIRESDVATATLPSREWNVFKLVDSILEANVSQSLLQLHTLVGSGAKAESAAMQNIFPNLSRNLRLVWQARVILDHRANAGNLSEEVKALLPEQGSFTAATEWQQRKAMAAARKVNFDQLAVCFEALARTDARLKGLETGFTSADTLERMVLEMIDAVRPVSTR